MIKKILLLSLLSTVSLIAAVDADILGVPHPQTTIYDVTPLLESDAFKNKMFPHSFKETFERDSKLIKGRIKEFFPDNQERLDDFKKARDFGRSLFEDGKDALSRDLTLTYLAYSALMSKSTSFTFAPKIIPPTDWKNPRERIGFCDSIKAKFSRYESVLSKDRFLYPVLSPTGLIPIDFINFLMANDIVVVGIPYEKQTNDYDQEKGASNLEFSLHDVFHGRFLRALSFDEDKEPKHFITQRHDIYNDMMSKGLEHFHVPYFLVFHEDGQIKSPFDGRKGVNPNPILNTIEHYQYVYPTHATPVDSILYAITHHQTGFAPYTGEMNKSQFGTSEQRDFNKLAHPLNADDVVLTQQIYENTQHVNFELKSRPNERFSYSSERSHKENIEQAMELVNLLNSYGANIDLHTEDASQFDIVSFRRVILDTLQNFAETYKEVDFS